MYPSQAVAAPLGNATHHQEMTDHGKNSLPHTINIAYQADSA